MKCLAKNTHLSWKIKDTLTVLDYNSHFSSARIRWTKCERANKKLFIFMNVYFGGENKILLIFPPFLRERNKKTLFSRPFLGGVK